jgi:hypothetical protein
MFAVIAVTLITSAQVTIAAAEVITLYCTNGRYDARSLSQPNNEPNYQPLANPTMTVVIDTQARTLNNVPTDVFDETTISFKFDKSIDAETEETASGVIDRITGRFTIGGVMIVRRDNSSVALPFTNIFDCSRTKPKPQF